MDEQNGNNENNNDNEAVIALAIATAGVVICASPIGVVFGLMYLCRNSESTD